MYQRFPETIGKLRQGSISEHLYVWISPLVVRFAFLESILLYDRMIYSVILNTTYFGPILKDIDRYFRELGYD